MKKQFTLLMVALLLSVMGANAKEKTTTLWEGTSADDAEIYLSTDKFSTAKAGDAIRITFSFTSAGSMHLCYKTGENGDWNAKAFNGINEWPYYDNTSVTSADFSIDATDLTTLQTYGMYIYGFKNSTITKIELITEVPATDGTELLNESWPGSWTQKNFAAQSAAKIGDVIQVQYKAFKDDSTDWPWVQFYFMDAAGNNFVDPVAGSKEKNSVTTFEFEIKTADVLEKIQNAGFSIKGDLFILTSVKLLTYADSYDAVSITVGSDGKATYSNGNKNVQISACDALKAYYASAVAKGTVTLTELTGCIPANTGVMIYGAEGTYTVPVGGEGWPGEITNYLKPTGDNSANVAASTDGSYHYIFAKKGDEEPGFYKLTKKHTLADHKAYLETSEDITPETGTSTGPARASLIFIDDETTSIKKVEKVERNDGVFYNLAGQRVAQPTKGLYIVNGKKVVIK